MSTGIENEDPNYFDSFSWDYNGNIKESNKEEKINVEITLHGEELDMNNFDVDDIEEIIVSSAGRVNQNKITEQTSFKLNPPEGFTPPDIGEYPDNPKLVQDNYLTDDNKKWVSGNSGNINDTGENIEGDPEEAVVFRGPGNSLKLNNGSAFFEGKTFYFDDEDGTDHKEHPIQIFSNSKLGLYSNTIIFYIDIEFKKTGNEDIKEDGKLCLNTAEDNDTEEGLVYFTNDLVADGETLVKKGAYNFPNEGVCLPKDSNLLTPYSADRSNIDNWIQKWE